MKKNVRVVIDFDSTFMKVEALDELAKIVTKDKSKSEQRRVFDEVQRITDLGMEGKLSFNASLKQRLALMEIDRGKIDELVEILKKKVSTSFERNRDFFREYKGCVYIVSNGFKEFIEPIVADYHIDSQHVLANTFVFNESDLVIGFDESNLLAHSGGKPKVLKSLKLKGEVYAIGDAYTDYEMKAGGGADKFFAFTENIRRESILAKADHITPSLDEFLYVNNMPMSISYPKNRIKILLLENVHADANKILSEEGYDVKCVKGALTEDELVEAIKDVSVVGIRSKTHITPRVLKAANRLMSVCAFCIGTNQIDLAACANQGVVVFNAPFSNTRSVVELAIAEIIMLMRQVPHLSHHLHKGEWKKTAVGSFEVRGKKLGIVGYGNIGKQLSVLAENLGMDVHYYDLDEQLPLGNATKSATLHAMLNKVDAVSLHVDGRPGNEFCFGEPEFEAMKEGSILLNLGRGFVVKIDALVKHLKSGKLRGAAVDVFPKEPKTNNDPFESELMGLSNVILTPHIGGSTQEAQHHIGNFVPAKIMAYINSGNTTGSVNFPEIQLPAFKDAHRLIHIHHNEPGILSEINVVLSKHQTNIVGQYLKTNEYIGYVITDIDKEYGEDVFNDLKKIKGTIKFRVLY